MSSPASPGPEAGSRPARAPAAASAADGAGLREQVLDALGTVYDPELDEPITQLRFVTSCEVSPEGDVAVVLRLPTPQCAPNFAFLMGADARRAVAGCRACAASSSRWRTTTPARRSTPRSAAARASWARSRARPRTMTWRRCASSSCARRLIARQARVCEGMLADGWSREGVVSATVAQLPYDSADAVRALELREQLGFSADRDAPAFVMPNGEPVAPDQLTRWLRAARLVRTSLEANGGICRSLLAFRHNLDSETQEVGR